MNAQNMHVISKNVNVIDAGMSVDCIASHAQNADRYTILRAYEPAGKILEFTDGEWCKQKGVRKTFLHDANTFEARDLKAVYRRLRHSTAHAVFIHGLPKPGVSKQVRRMNVNFVETPHNVFMLDFDKLGVLTDQRGEVVTDPAECARIVRARMSPEFHDAALIWNATSGHGLEGGKTRLRLIAWASRPINLAEAKAWAIRQGLEADLSIYRKTQPVFLAPPTIATEGMKDPVSERWGMLDGKAAVEVPADLHAVAAKEHERLKTVAPGCVIDAPHMVERFLYATLQPRNADRIGESGRHMAIFNAANDAFDFGLSRETASALLNLWFGHESDDALFNAIEHLTDIMPKQAEGIAQEVRACGAAIGDAWHGEAMDESDVERMIDDAITSRTSPHGCKFEKQLGDAFGAIQEDEDGTTSFAKIEAVRWAADNGVTIDAAMLYDLRCALEDDGVKAETAGVMCRALSEHSASDYVLGETDDLLSKMDDKARKAREKAEKTSLPAMLFRSADDIADNFKPMDWSIRGLLPRRGIGFFIAPSHAGKSFAIIDLAGHLGQGRNWLGHKIAQKYCVLYVTGEGRDGVDQRLRAWILRNGGTHGNVAVMESPPNLFADGNAEARIVAAAKALMAATGSECALIVFDTLASLCTGMDENSAQDVGKLTKRMRGIAEKTDAAIMVVHHTGVTNQTRGRGSSAFFGNGDFEFQISVDEKGGKKERFLKNSKQRDDARNEKGHPFTFDKVKVGEYEDDGEPIYSLVFVASEQPDASAFGSVTDENDEQDDAPDLGESKRPALKPLDARVLALAGEFERPFSRDELQERYNRVHGKVHGELKRSTAASILSNHQGLRTRKIETDDNKKTSWEIIVEESALD
jgi:putative DNA primase/helicase